jgi:hypothetical protein
MQLEPNQARIKPTVVPLGAVAGVRELLVYCGDYRVSHSTEISADQWSDYIRPFDFKAVSLSDRRSPATLKNELRPIPRVIITRILDQRPPASSS